MSLKLPEKPRAAKSAVLPAKLSAELRRSAARNPVLHIVAPGLEVAQAVPRKGETVTAFLRRTGWATRDPKYGWQFRKQLPTILEVNGEAVLRNDWRRTKIAANDNVRFVSFPRGGRGSSGKQVIGLVALIAVAAFAGPLGGMAATALGFAAGTTAFTVASTVATALIGIGGSLLINALVSPGQGATSENKTDQIYSASASGNMARLGQPLPVWYGRNKDYPDFAATPWGEFVGNDQYLNVLLSVTMGSMDYEAIYNSDTLFWDKTTGIQEAFSSAQIAFYEPNETVTLFPVNVAQSDEVGGIQVPNGTGLHVPSPGGDVGNDYGDGQPPSPGAWLGPFAANPPGTNAYQIAIDYVFPAGCYIVWGKNGEIGPIDVGVTAEARPINDAGAAIGSYFNLQTTVLTVGTKSPQRGTLVAALPSDGRYEVRFRRNEGVPNDTKGGAELVWAGLRAFLRGDSQFPVSTIAIRVKASETTQGSFKFGVLGTRKLPVWNGTAFVTQATRSPAWALYDMATNAQYGAEINVGKVDFNALVNHATGCTSRGDKFDYVLKAAVAVPEAFDTALTGSRARHIWLGDTLSLVRDQWESVPAMLLTDREIVRDSTSFEYTMLGDEDPDAVVIEYIDEDTWLPATVQYPPNSESFTSVRSETKRINGIVNRAHAYRECAFYYLCSIYRRETGSIGCEYEGRAITMGQTLRLQSELPQDYGYAGSVIDRSGNTLTLDPAPVWATGEQHYIRLRRPNGREFGPVRASKGAADNIAILDSGDVATAQSQQGITLTNVLKRADAGEYPTYAIGTSSNQSKLVKVLTGQPNDEGFTLSLVVDDERVHATDIGNPPVLPIGQFPKNDASPLVVGLTASFGQGVAEPRLGASWFPTAGAYYYRAEVSYDSGNTWIEIYQGGSPNFEKLVTLGALTLRVQAVGKFPGPWSQVSVTAPTIQIQDSTVALQSVTDAVRQQITDVMDERFSDMWREITRVAVLSQQSISRTFLDKDEVRSEQVTLYDKNKSYIDSVKTTAADSDAALAQSITSLGVTVAGNKLLSEAAITDTYQTLATADSSLAQKIEDVSAAISDSTSELRGRVTQIEQVNVTQDGVISGIGSTVTSEVSRLDGRVDTTNANLTTTNNNLSTTNSNLSTVSATVSTQGTAIATLNGYAHAQWSVKTDVNGNVLGLITLDSTSTKSTFTVVANTFYVCQPGVSGGTAVPMFAIDSVNGTNRLVFDGNMYADGGIYARSIAANQITATHMTANSVTAANGAIANFAVQSLKIADQAVIVPQLATGGVVYGPGGATEATAVSTNISINTTGLAGKTITLAIMFSGQQSTAGGNNWTVSIDVNGSNVSGYFGGTTFQPAFSVTASYSFTASGGTDVITVAGKYAAQTSMQINSSTLMILGCKR